MGCIYPGLCLTPVPPTRPDPDPFLQAGIPAQPWPIPVPTEVTDAQGWGCLSAPHLPPGLPCTWLG